MPGDAAKPDDSLSRRFAYLLDQEKEERGERRGLEQRATGLLGAMLISFPVSATVAKEADQESFLGITGLVLMLIVLVVTLHRTYRVIEALAPSSRSRKAAKRDTLSLAEPRPKDAEAVSDQAGSDQLGISASNARALVRQALADGDLAEATKQQAAVVEAVRGQNVALVSQVQGETRQFLTALVLLLASLALLVLSVETDSSSADSQKPPGIERQCPEGKLRSQ